MSRIILVDQRKKSDPNIDVHPSPDLPQAMWVVV